MRSAEFAVWLIKRHESLFTSADERFRNFAFRFCETAPDVKRILVSLERDIPLVSGTQCLVSAQAWWKQHQAAVSVVNEFEEFQRLHTLLRYLDAAYSSKRETSMRVGIDQLFLGRRWWNARARQESRGRQAPLDGLSFRIATEFPHIRIIKGANETGWVVHDRPDTFANAIKERKLRIGLCALRGSATTVFEPTRVVSSDGPSFGFVASGINQKEGSVPYGSELREAIQWARERRLHIICFPELSICVEGRRIIFDELVRDPGVLSLIVVGSFHKTRDSETLPVNSAPYWIVDDSRVVHRLGEFVKTQPFFMSIDTALHFSNLHATCNAARSAGCRTVVEDIVLGGAPHIIQTPVGTFGIVICKDFLAGRDLLDRYAPIIDHLLVPSMNAAASAWFFSGSEELARTNAVATFYVNCTQAVDDPSNTDVDMAFLHTPGVHDGKKRYFRQANSRSGNLDLPEAGLVDAVFDIPATLASPW